MNENSESFRSIFDRAKAGETPAVETLFAGFIGDTEKVRDCGYLGVIGYIFPDHSFWCLTDKRMCGLQLRRGGRMRFVAGFTRLINSMTVRQPSLIVLWVLIIFWLLLAAVMTALVYVFTTALVDSLLWSYGPVIRVGVTALVALFLLWMTRWLIRIFYRLTKTGCTFWVREGLPVYLFADRQNVAETQKLVRLFTDAK